MTNSPQGPLTGKVAWVTGASSGIGAATVHRLTELGAEVAGLDLTTPTTSPGAFAQVDVSDPTSVARAATELTARSGPADILVLAAGTGGQGGRTLLEADLADWNRVFDVNVGGILLMIRACMGGMIERGWGRIVTVSSGSGTRVYPRAGAYAVSKAAVMALTKIAAHEGGPHGVTVNCVAPGLTDTAMLRASHPDPDALAALVANSPVSNPMKYLLQPEDQAAAISWFCLPEAAHVTGQTLYVNGGSYMP